MTKPTEPTGRKCSSRIIYVCTGDCQVWADEPGPCPDVDCIHRLRKRRALVCSRCTQAYYCQTEFDEHECGDCL
jgi:hypothetical protein